MHIFLNEYTFVLRIMTLNAMVDDSTNNPPTARLATDIRYGTQGSDLVVLIHRDGYNPHPSFLSGVFFVRDYRPSQVAEIFEKLVRERLFNVTFTGGDMGPFYEYKLKGIPGFDMGAYLASNAHHFQRPKTYQEMAEEWADLELYRTRKIAEACGLGAMGQSPVSRMYMEEFRKTLIDMIRTGELKPKPFSIEEDIKTVHEIMDKLRRGEKP